MLEIASDAPHSDGAITPGTTLSSFVQSRTTIGLLPDEDEVVSIGRELAATLDATHAGGRIHRGLISTAVIFEGRRVRVLDPEGPLDQVDSFAHDSTGYESPQQRRGEPAAATDDIYAMGALLYLLATGGEPSRAPDPGELLGRPIPWLNPEIGPALIAVIERCLAPDATERYQSMTEVGSALRDAARADRRSMPAGTMRIPPREEQARADARSQARRLGDTICAVSLEAPDGTGRFWRCAEPSATETKNSRLATESAGVVLALAEIVNELNDPTHQAVLVDSAHWLRVTRGADNVASPGLYTGEGVIGMALLRAGQILHDRTLVSAAAERGRRIATMPYRSLGLFDGAAGRVRIHLWLYDETGDLSHLEDAIDAGDVLVRVSHRQPNGELSSMNSDGRDSGHTPLGTGYAHGVSGIADALLDLYEASNDGRYLDTARGAARWLADIATPMLADGSGLGWPDLSGQPPRAGFWCRGAAGIGRFFLHASQLDLIPDAWNVAFGAARTAAATGRFAGPALCHGLAGNIDTLLDVYQATGDSSWLRNARELAQILDAYAIARNGHLYFGGDRPNVYSPEYMTGYGGVAVTLLRLSAPDRLPHQLSQRGFGQRPRQTRLHAGGLAGEII